MYVLPRYEGNITSRRDLINAHQWGLDAGTVVLYFPVIVYVDVTVSELGFLFRQPTFRDTVLYCECMNLG